MAVKQIDGLCECGCGEAAPIAQHDYRQRGWTKGQPIRFIQGHQHRVLRQSLPDPNPSGLCMCGCGAETLLAPNTNQKLGRVKDKPYRYLRGHHHRGKRFIEGPLYFEEDRGHATLCWIWNGAHHDGYGQAANCGNAAKAHRWMYEKVVGPIPEGLEIDHLCRVRCCVNPDHLEPVTAEENQRRAGRVKLIRDDVRAIRASSERRVELAVRYGVTAQQIGHVQRGLSWKDVA